MVANLHKLKKMFALVLSRLMLSCIQKLMQITTFYWAFLLQKCKSLWGRSVKGL